MSQVFLYSQINHSVVSLFKDSMAGPRISKVPDPQTGFYTAHESKSQTEYRDNAAAMAQTSNKNSVPQQRGRFTQSTLHPTRP